MRILFGGLVVVLVSPFLLMAASMGDGGAKDGAVSFLVALAVLVGYQAGASYLVDGVVNQMRRSRVDEARVREVQGLLDHHYASGAIGPEERAEWQARLRDLAAKDRRHDDAARRAGLLRAHGWSLALGGAILLAFTLLGASAATAHCMPRGSCTRYELDQLKMVLSLPVSYATGLSASLVLSGLLALALGRRAASESARQGTSFDEGAAALKEEILSAIRTRALSGPRGP